MKKTTAVVLVIVGMLLCGSGFAATVSGSVYVDANWDGAMGTDEPTVAGVTVLLYNANRQLVGTATTDSYGAYAFGSLAKGIFGVTIPKWAMGSAMNEVLSDLFLTTTAIVSIANTWNGDSAGNNFGYAPNTEFILEYMSGYNPFCDCAEFRGDGKTIGFWKHQLTVATKGKGAAQIDAVTLAGYLQQIEAFFLPVPFQFGGNMQAALKVLSSNSSDAKDLLAKQLLATEFNEMAGLGIQGNPSVAQPLLLAWGEYLLAHPDEFTREELLAAKDIFDSINNTGE